MRHIDYVLSVVAPGRNGGSGTGGGTGGTGTGTGTGGSGTGTGSGGGGGDKPAAGVAPKEVNFYDYDGTVIAAYTAAEAQKLTALPDAPEHEGLLFQAWNWTLERVNALTHRADIGAMYITDDGKTRLRIRIADAARSDVPLYFTQTVENGVTVDWGDGSATETASGKTVTITHKYAAAGEYVIALEVAEGCTLGIGHSSKYSILGDATGYLDTDPVVYNNMLKEANIGQRVTRLGRYAFGKCYSLERVTIPEGVTYFDGDVFNSCFSLAHCNIPKGPRYPGMNMFYQCHSFESVSLPEGLTEFASNAFCNCERLASIAIPDGVTGFGSYGALGYCRSLASITFPESVTNIPGNTTQYCTSLKEYHLKPTTPPTLTSTTGFNVPDDCIIYVPKGCLAAYQAATNWATYASKMKEEGAA